MLCFRWNPFTTPVKVPNLPDIQSRLAYVSCNRQLEVNISSLRNRYQQRNYWRCFVSKGYTHFNITNITTHQSHTQPWSHTRSYPCVVVSGITSTMASRFTFFLNLLVFCDLKFDSRFSVVILAAYNKYSMINIEILCPILTKLTMFYRKWRNPTTANTSALQSTPTGPFNSARSTRSVK